jgi:hypothetical protein
MDQEHLPGHELMALLRFLLSFLHLSAFHTLVSEWLMGVVRHVSVIGHSAGIFCGTSPVCYHQPEIIGL